MIAFMYGYFFIKALKIGFYVMIAIFAIIIIGVLYQYAKELYVLRNFDDVYKIELSKPIQTYREITERSGYSWGRYITTHYRIRRVPDKIIRRSISWQTTSSFITEVFRLSAAETRSITAAWGMISRQS